MPRQAGALEIEITPEMVAAATLALSKWDDRFMNFEDAAVSIVKAALLAMEQTRGSLSP